eukprot:2825818-Prymnesium_polylepis.1
MQTGDPAGRGKVTSVLVEESPWEARTMGGANGVLGRLSEPTMHAWGGGMDAMAAKLAIYEKFRSLENERRLLIGTGEKRIIEVSRDRR